jgi:cell division protein FtsN
LIIVNNNKEAEKERIEQEQRNKQVIEGMDEDYIKMMDKKRKAELDAKAEKEKRAEEERRHTVEKKQVEQKKQEAENKATEAKKEAASEKNLGEGAITALTDEIMKRKSAEEEAKKATASAEENAKAAKAQEEKAKLTEEFYKELRKAQSEKKLKEVCTALEIQDAKNNDDRYNKIEAKFNSAKDNAARRSIINTVKNTKKKKLFGKNSETQEEGEPK